MTGVRVDTGPQAVPPARLRAASARAPRVYPDPVGPALARELDEWAVFGYRLGGGALIARLCDVILRKPMEERS